MASEGEFGAAQAANSGERQRPPLSDADLDRIPRGARERPACLSASAIAVYRELRRFARGGALAWPATTTVARRLRCSEDTVQRCLGELEGKGFLDRTGRKRGRAVEYRLLRGAGEVYELRWLEPQPAVEEPQLAAVTEVRTERGPYGPDLSRSKRSAAAPPLPARAGESAAKEEERKSDPERRRSSEPTTRLEQRSSPNGLPSGRNDSTSRSSGKAPASIAVVPTVGGFGSGGPSSADSVLLGAARSP